MIKLKYKILLLFIAIYSLAFSVPPPNQKTRILFVFDASYSMAGYWENKVKMDVARDVLIQIIDSLEKIDNVELALRVYGHQSTFPPQDCEDTRLEVPFRPNSASAIRQKLRIIKPRGTTPLAYSLEECGKDFPRTDENVRNIVILITDGKEECSGDPCLISEELQRQGITLKPFIIGIGIDENFTESFNCIGTFYNAAQPEQLGEVLNIVITQVLNQTTAQVNLLDKDGLPTETDVNMTFYDNYSGTIVNNLIHTINYKGNPDTLILDPLLKYDMRVNTIPPVWVKNIEVFPGKHTIISASTPQGYLIINSQHGNDFRGLKATIKKAGQNEALNYQLLNSTSKYLIGNYDIDIPVLPPIHLKNVEIKQSHTTKIEIPRPGIANIFLGTTGVGSIYIREGKNIKWIYDLQSNTSKENLVLLPGKYLIVFRAQNAKQIFYTRKRDFEIESGSSITINFQ